MELQRSCPNHGPEGFQGRTWSLALQDVPVRTTKFQDFVAVVDSCGFFNPLPAIQSFRAR